MIDEELVEKKIDLILKNLDYLEEVKEIDDDVLLKSFEKLQATKHSLQEVIESCIDISNHIISSEGLERAETYSEMFERLYENDVIGSDLNDRLGNMARFRNLLVHRYGIVDDKKVLHILRERLSDIYKFIEDVEKFLDEYSE
ncbi:MAG: type VII toxin-antitoxin system HepT family RNase toxin [Candidatus Natronoplasma sp.]